MIKGGMTAAWPICIGCIPLGFAFGVLAQKGGFSDLFVTGSPRQLDVFQPKSMVATPTFIFALKTRSLGGTVIVGMALFWLAMTFFWLFAI